MQRLRRAGNVPDDFPHRRDVVVERGDGVGLEQFSDGGLMGYPASLPVKG